MSLQTYVDEFCQLLHQVDQAEVMAMVDAIVDAYNNDAFVFIIGNGGSGANASHLCEDLAKGTLCDFDNQKRLKVLSLTDNTPAILAWGNDEGYDRIFVEQLKNYGHPGALVIAISGSGNSPNILKAVEYANAHGMKTFGMTGYDGGKLKQIAHQGMHVPCMNMGVCEAVHDVFYHYVIEELYRRFKAMREL
ncbi:MAG: SIS domain-containing protein [bacterium]|jgi:D-sedoheptulose 7-phosphate isomerase|nr:SIS domain-containing protein [bacterium]